MMIRMAFVGVSAVLLGLAGGVQTAAAVPRLVIRNEGGVVLAPGTGVQSTWTLSLATVGGPSVSYARPPRTARCCGMRGSLT
jgi:hypothetical protein